MAAHPHRARREAPAPRVGADVLRDEVLHGDMTGLPTSTFDLELWGEALS
jgi:hypothetical protein